MKLIYTKQNKTYEITEEQSEQIAAASIDGTVPGIWVNGDFINFFQIVSITDKPERVERIALPPGKGYEGIIKNAPNRGLEQMAKGLKKFIDGKNMTGVKTPYADKMLEQMRLQYAKKNKQKQLA